MKLNNVPAKVWERVLDEYIQTNAILEIRTIKWIDDEAYGIQFAEGETVDGSTNESVASYVPHRERFQIRVEKKEPQKGPVSALCGDLQRFNDGKLTWEYPTLMQWRPELIAWHAPIGNKTADTGILALCGNVIGFSADVVTIVNDALSPLYEWNRPDAPKTGEPFRRWLLGARNNSALLN